VTLLLCLVTPQHALIASDRQLTFADGKVHEHHSNKALALGDSMLLAYTGIAEIGRPRRYTDRWLFDLFASQTRGFDPIEVVREAAPAAVRATNGPGSFTAVDRRVLRRLAVLTVAFLETVQIGPDGKSVIPLGLTPRMQVVTNALVPGQNGGLDWLPESRDTFEVINEKDDAEHTGLRLLELGQNLKPKARRELERDLRRVADHGGLLSGFARLLARAIQRCHDEGNPWVGRNVMVTYITLDADPPSDEGPLWTAPMVPLLDDPPESAFFGRPVNVAGELRPRLGYFYLPGDRNSRVHYSPNIIRAGSGIPGAKWDVPRPGDTFEFSVDVARLPVPRPGI
jgi:hypothetical protein